MPRVVAGQIFEKRFITVLCGIEWRVDEVQSILQREGDECRCDPIEFCSGRWMLNMKAIAKKGNVYVPGIRIHRISKSSHTNHIECKLIKINSDGEEHILTETKAAANKAIWQRWVTLDVYDRNVIRSDETVLHLKVVCSLECIECKSEEARNYPRLLENQKIIAEGRGSNVKIFVKDREFTVNEDIIRHYSPVFDAMFRHDMLESSTKEVNITACEPEIFNLLLDSFYYGRLQIDSMDAVYSLYHIADMYEASKEREICVKYMLRNLDLETFCDILALSLLHMDSNLREAANQFFDKNSEEITRTHRWRAFSARNPDAANGFLSRVGS